MAANDILAFFVLACAITWLADIPMLLATVSGTPPTPIAMALGGLGAFGPTFAASIVAGRRHALGQVFGRWRTRPVWLAIGLLTLPALHFVATIAEVALGGRPTQWFYPPSAPEHVAALVMFSFGEEFGWRGFAYPRLADRHGPVRACLVIGAVWAVWHFAMWFTPEGPPSARTIGLEIVELAAASLVFA